VENPNTEYKFYTNTNYDECINILTTNIKEKWLNGDFIGNIENESFSMKYADFSRYATRYRAPIFRGKLIRVEEKTIIVGGFNNPTGYFAYEIFIMIIFMLGSIFMFLGSVFNLFSNPLEPNYQSPILMFVVCIISIIIGQGVPRKLKGFRDEDREKIIEFIKVKLKATKED